MLSYLFSISILELALCSLRYTRLPFGSAPASTLWLTYDNAHISNLDIIASGYLPLDYHLLRCNPFKSSSVCVGLRYTYRIILAWGSSVWEAVQCLSYYLFGMLVVSGVDYCRLYKWVVDVCVCSSFPPVRTWRERTDYIAKYR